MGFRLLTEYHSFLLFDMGSVIPMFKTVSVSLWSIIHSYLGMLMKFLQVHLSFRLLTEYHSFLYFIEKYVFIEEDDEFPSPYGVSFILIYVCYGI